jgi:hypothetical protein
VRPAVFFLNSDDPKIRPKIIIAADDRSLAELIGLLWQLLAKGHSSIQLRKLGTFEHINVADVVFERANTSHMEFDGAKLKILSDDKHLQKYTELLETLVGSRGHQYLDSESQNRDIELLVSVGEYNEAFVERLKRDRPGTH